MVDRTMLSGLVPIAFQKITLSNSTAVGLNSTIKALGGSVLRLSVETQNARFREDGTDPTLTTGVALFTGRTYFWEGLNATGNALAFQRSTGVSTINIMSYKHTGDRSQS